MIQIMAEIPWLYGNLPVYIYKCPLFSVFLTIFCTGFSLHFALLVPGVFWVLELFPYMPANIQTQRKGNEVPGRTWVKSSWKPEQLECKYLHKDCILNWYTHLSGKLEENSTGSMSMVFSCRADQPRVQQLSLNIIVSFGLYFFPKWPYC